MIRLGALVMAQELRFHDYDDDEERERERGEERRGWEGPAGASGNTRTKGTPLAAAVRNQEDRR